MKNRKSDKKYSTVLIIKGNRMRMFEYGIFKCRRLLDTFVYTGKNGFALEKREGDMKTPVGVFRPALAFGRAEQPDTGLDYIKITPYHFWVDDINSAYYNKLANSNFVAADWNSSEHLAEYKTEYEFAVDIGYNKKCKKGRGSAVFLHCVGNRPYTSGCVAANRDDVLLCLKYLTQKSRIIILP